MRDRLAVRLGPLDSAFRDTLCDLMQIRLKMSAGIGCRKPEITAGQMADILKRCNEERHNPIHRSVTMLLIREVFHCRPGKVRPLLEKFQAMNRIMAKAGQGSMRLMTDFTGERYWTLVAEFETPGMAEFEKMMQGEGMSEADTKEFERLMEGYHDLIDSGHREIYRLEPATKG